MQQGGGPPGARIRSLNVPHDSDTIQVGLGLGGNGFQLLDRLPVIGDCTHCRTGWLRTKGGMNSKQEQDEKR